MGAKLIPTIFCLLAAEAVLWLLAHLLVWAAVRGRYAWLGKRIEKYYARMVNERAETNDTDDTDHGTDRFDHFPQ